jgi:hypothetical protein
MADEVFSVKIDNELKQELEQLAESSGQNKKEFMASLIASYQSRLLENQSNGPEIPELSTLHQHVCRIEEIYVSLAASRRDIAAEAAQRQTAMTTELATVKAELLDAQKAAEQATIEAKETVKAILAETAEQIEAAETKSAELISRAVAAEQTADLTKDLLAAEQKIRATAEATATNLVNRVEVAETTANNALTDADQANGQVAKLKIVIAAATEKITQYEKTIADQKTKYDEQTEINLKTTTNQAAQYERVIADLKAKYTDQIASIKDHATIEKDRAVLLAEKNSFEKIQALQTALNEAQKISNRQK